LIALGIGKTTRELAELEESDHLADLLGPLGRPAHVEKKGTVACVGGGVGIAELLPVARAFRDAGNYVVSICGARTNALRILDDELHSCSDEVVWATDDGSFGFHGNVVQLLRHWRETSGRALDMVHAIGPLVMMRATAEATREWGVPTMASLNPIMVDGTGMCGGCRVTVGGKTLFACVDGPEFDAHSVNFEELARRNRAYVEQETAALERHQCLVGLGR
jgi:ferredoxin--NADP+ reductase